jgi:hypothetical protein
VFAALLVGLAVVELVEILSLIYATDPDTIRKATVAITVVTFILITVSTIVTSKNMDAREIVTGFLVGLVGTVVTVVGIQVYLLSDRVGSVGDLVKTANKEIAEAVKTFTKDQMGSMSSAIKALEKALEIKQEVANDELLSKAEKLHPGLEAMGLSYSAWVTRLQSEDKYVGHVWQAAFPTFYREEAFDIRHGEIVTNGRNFCYLLLATLSQLLEGNSGKTIVYYQVTPVHPKDWYNWPHGFGEHHCYFENEFIGVYHRSLRALIEWAKAKKTTDGPALLEHGRFILCSGDDGAPQVNRFGWDLPGTRETDSYKSCWVLDVPILLSTSDGLRLCEICSNLISYYKRLLQEANKQLHLPSGNDYYAVPVWSKNWEVANSLASVRDIVQKLKDEAKSIPCPACIQKLKDAAVTHLDGKIGSAILSIEKTVASLKDSQPRLVIAWEHVASFARKWNTADFPRFLQNYHLASVLLSNSRSVDEDIRGILPSVLRKRSAMECAGWADLYCTFAGHLHSTPGLARIVHLTENQVHSWPVQEPEFAAFGIRDGDSIRWKVFVATSLDYPFDVARIRIFEENGSDYESREYQKYRDLISNLVSGCGGYSVKQLMGQA